MEQQETLLPLQVAPAMPLLFQTQCCHRNTPCSMYRATQVKIKVALLWVKKVTGTPDSMMARWV